MAGPGLRVRPIPMEELTSIFNTCMTFLSQNWTIIVCVALGVLLYNVVKDSLHIVLTLVAVGILLTVLTHLGYFPPLDQILASFQTMFAGG